MLIQNARLHFFSHLIQEVAAHQGIKASKLAYASALNKLVSTGFSKARDRQLWLWDTRQIASGPVTQINLDQSPGVLSPYVDHDSGLCVLTGKGDGNVRFYELVVSVCMPCACVYAVCFLCVCLCACARACLRVHVLVCVLVCVCLFACSFVRVLVCACVCV